MRFFGQALASFLSADGRVVRSVRQLLFQPGVMTADWTRGARVRNLTPVQLFLLVNLTVVVLASVLHVPSWSTTSQAWDVDQWQVLLREQASELGMEPARHRRLFEATASGIAKATVAAVIPLGALLSLLLHVRRERRLGIHLVLATHLVGFLLLVPDLVISGLLGEFLYGLGREPGGSQSGAFVWLRLLAPTVPLILWLSIAFRRVFRVSPGGAILRGTIGGLTFFYLGAILHQWLVLHVTLWRMGAPS